MAVYTCECGLIISTSSVRPRCLRCLRVLGPQNLADDAAGGVGRVAALAMAMVERQRQLRQVTMGLRLGTRPIIPPIVRPK